jgi:ribosomal protein S18 acetylase RimI-like enzyme
VTLDIASHGAATVTGIRELKPDDVDSLRFGFWSRVSNEEVKRTIRSYPGRSVWLPDSLEYAIVGPWRHRAELANVQELSAVRHPAELLAAVVELADRFDTAAVISIEIDEVRTPAFYERAGFRLLEEVVTYDFDCRQPASRQSSNLRFRVADLSHIEDLNLLLELDHASFPWLWWNSEEEFQAYARAPGVEILVGYDGDRPVSYLGITAYLGWGHLDRIAVVPERQGRGYGGESLAVAIDRLKQTGAKRIGLSTQRKNERSQRLYERFGFRRAAEHDYRLYGRVLRLPDGIAHVTEED